jgi:hypothetical protein
MKKLHFILSLCYFLPLVCLTSCTTGSSAISLPLEEEEATPVALHDSGAVQTVRSFLKWYSTAANEAQQIRLYTCGTTAQPETYRVSKTGQARYLALLASSGNLSGLYIDSLQRYFKEVDEWLIERPSSEGACEGLDFDLVMDIPCVEPGMALEHSSIEDFSVTGHTASVTIHLTAGITQHYRLTQKDGKWWIDQIRKEG